MTLEEENPLWKSIEELIIKHNIKSQKTNFFERLCCLFSLEEGADYKKQKVDEFGWGGHNKMIILLSPDKFCEIDKFYELKPRNKPNWEGIIYFISNSREEIKIGFTSGSIEKRIMSLQCSSPTKLFLVAKVYGNVKIEKKLHRDLKEFSLCGEWFSDEVFKYLDPSLDIEFTAAGQAWLKNLINKWNGKSLVIRKS